jgi:hypothetical protein
VPLLWLAAPLSGVLRHYLQWPMMTTCDNCGVDGLTITEPTTAVDVVVVVAPAATPPPPPLTATTATPRGPSTSTLGPTPFRCGLVLGGVDVQQPLLSAMLAGALPYGLPPQQADPNFVPPLALPPSVAWTLWMTSDALPTVFLRSRSAQSSHHPWHLHLRQRGHR